jgi:hypothetical protein
VPIESIAAVMGFGSYLSIIAVCALKAPRLLRLWLPGDSHKPIASAALTVSKRRPRYSQLIMPLDANTLINYADN